MAGVNALSANYEMPDVMGLNNSQRRTTAGQWKQRREEIRDATARRPMLERRRV
jgi:hypothetical protein